MIEPLDLDELLVELDSDEGTNFGLPIAAWSAVLREAFIDAYVRAN